MRPLGPRAAIAATIAGAVFGATLLSLFLVPTQRPEDLPGRGWYSRDSTVRAAERQAASLRDSLRAARLTFERLDSRDHARGLRGRRDGLTVSVASGVPRDVADRFVTAASAELRALTATPAHPIALRIITDPLLRVGHRLVTVRPATAGDPCVVVVRVSLESASPRAPRDRAQLLSICGFYALFGMPGAGVEAWLERTGGALATRHTVIHGLTRRRQTISVTDLGGGSVYASCSMGNVAACEDLFEGEFAPWALPVFWDAMAPAAPLPVPGVTGVTALPGYFDWIGNSRHSFGAMRQSLGDERFVQIWRSADEPKVAFERSEGFPLSTWIRDQLRTEIEPYQTGGLRFGLPLVLALTMIGAGFALTLRFAQRRFDG